MNIKLWRVALPVAALLIVAGTVTAVSGTSYGVRAVSDTSCGVRMDICPSHTDVVAALPLTAPDS